VLPCYQRFWRHPCMVPPPRPPDPANQGRPVGGARSAASARAGRPGPAQL